MPKRIGPEAKVIQLFTALPEDSKRIVLDVIKSQTATPRKSAPKSTAPSVHRKSSRSTDQKELIQNTAEPKASVSGATKAQDRYVPVCVICNNEQAHAVHQTDAVDFHLFRSELKKASGATA